MEANIANSGRRFLKTRQKAWVQSLASKICQSNITPNQISVVSIFSAIAAAACLITIEHNLKWLLAIGFIQFRLFCNLMDGMVAIEGGKRSQLGNVYNDLPDRIADIFIIVGFGHAIDNLLVYQFLFISLSNSNLSWLAATLAVFTAYIRTLFSSLGTKTDYSGPMAKQHRMALISASCLLSYTMGITGYANNIPTVIITTLFILNIGMLCTLYIRTINGARELLCR